MEDTDFLLDLAARARANAVDAALQLVVSLSLVAVLYQPRLLLDLVLRGATFPVSAAAELLAVGRVTFLFGALVYSCIAYVYLAISWSHWREARALLHRAPHDNA